MSNINEELNYIKYLLGYQRDKTLLEQKIILEQSTKSDYDQIVSSLLTSYTPTLEKYGFNNITLYGIDEKNNLTTDYTGTPTIIGFSSTSPVSYYNNNYSNYYFGCGNGVGKKYKNPDTLELESAPSNSGAPYAPFRENYGKTGKTDAEKTKLKDNLSKTMFSIASKVCELITLKSTGQDVQTQLDAIAETEAKANQPKTPTTPAKPTTPVSQIGTNRYTEPKFTVSYDKNFKKWIVEGFGSLATGSADSGTFDELLIKKIKEAVNKANDPLLVQNKDYITLTFAEIRGTASNSWGGPVAYNGEFDGTNWRVVKEVKPENPTENYTKNVNLAKKRANEILTKIKDELPKADENGRKINVNKNFIKSDVKSYSVNTGGLCDSCGGRDWNTYPLPGQSIYVKLTIKLQGPPPDKLKSEGCLTNAKITVGYFPAGSSIDKGQANHNCDTATFDLYMNDKLISTVDLGNGLLLHDGSECQEFMNSYRQTKSNRDLQYYNVCTYNKGKYKNLSNTKTDSKYGGMRYADIILSGALAKEINNTSKSGEVSIYIKGKDSDYYKTTRQLSNAKYVDANEEYSTHADTPWVMYYPKSNQTQTTIDEAPFGKLPRCGTGTLGPCTKNFVMRFNPCGKNAIETMMDSGVGEG